MFYLILFDCKSFTFLPPWRSILEREKSFLQKSLHIIYPGVIYCKTFYRVADLINLDMCLVIFKVSKW